MPLIDRLDSAISSRNGRGDSCFLIDQAEFAKDAIGKNRFEMESINDYVDLSFLDDVHLFPFVSLFENGCPGRERLRFRSICVDIADSHRVRIVCLALCPRLCQPLLIAYHIEGAQLL